MRPDLTHCHALYKLCLIDTPLQKGSKTIITYKTTGQYNQARPDTLYKLCMVGLPLQKGGKTITANATGGGTRSPKAATAALTHSLLLSLDVTQPRLGFLQDCFCARAGG